MSDTQTVALTVNIPISDLSPEAIHAAVIKAAVDRVLGISEGEGYDEDGNPFSRTFDAKFKQMRHEVQEIAEKQICEEVARKVPAVVDEIINGQFHPTNAYGERMGKTATIREYIGEYAKTWLTETVDANGRPSTYGDRAPRLHVIIKQEVDKQWAATIKAETDKITADIRAQMSGKISAAIAEVVTRIVGK